MRAKQVKLKELIAKRVKARADKAFDEADAIRDELIKMGIEIEDTPEGTIWRKN